MKITKVKIYKSKVTITFDKSKKLDIDKEVFTSFYLYEGKEVSSKEYKAILDLNNSNKLLQYALKLRSKSLYSEYKLREKLYAKEASKSQVDKIIKIMKANDLIDDKAFAFDLVEYYNSLNYGENKIKTKLLDKGIFKETVDKMRFPLSIEKKKANNIFPKLDKKYDKYNDTQKKSRIYNAYLSEGFSRDIASEMISRVKEANKKDELDKLKSDYLKAKNRLARKYKGKELRQKIISSLLTKGYRLNDIVKIIG